MSSALLTPPTDEGRGNGVTTVAAGKLHLVHTVFRVSLIDAIALERVTVI